MLTNSTADVQQQLHHVEHCIATLTAEQQRLESNRDTLIRQLADSDGAHDRRVVAVR